MACEEEKEEKKLQTIVSGPCLPFFDAIHQSKQPDENPPLGRLHSGPALLNAVIFIVPLGSVR